MTPRSYVQVLEAVNVSCFGQRVFANVIKLRIDPFHTCYVDSTDAEHTQHLARTLSSVL